MAKLEFCALGTHGNVVGDDGWATTPERAKKIGIDTDGVLAVTVRGITSHNIQGKLDYRHMREVVTTEGIRHIAAVNYTQGVVPDAIKSLDALGGKPCVTLARVYEGPFVNTGTLSGRDASSVVVSTKPEDLARITRGDISVNRLAATGINGMFTEDGHSKDVSAGTPIYDTTLFVGTEQIHAAHLSEARLKQILAPTAPERRTTPGPKLAPAPV